MKLAEHRKRLGLSLEELALQLGLKANSKGFLSRIENGAVPCPLRMALQIERWSGGLVTAAELLAGEDRKLLEDALERAAASRPSPLSGLPASPPAAARTEAHP
jgi:transcriptional regulator with XRE-family HTH domain